MSLVVWICGAVISVVFRCCNLHLLLHSILYDHIAAYVSTFAICGSMQIKHFFHLRYHTNDASHTQYLVVPKSSLSSRT